MAKGKTKKEKTKEEQIREELERFTRSQGLEVRQPPEWPVDKGEEIEPASPDPEPASFDDPRDRLYPEGKVPAWIEEARKLEDGREKRTVGRPKKNQKIRWGEIEHLYVFGEPYEGEDGGTFVRYPSMDELARRFHVNKSSIKSHAKRDQWAERRARISRRTEELVEESLIAQRAAKQLSIRERTLETTTLLLEQFHGAVEEGRVEISSVGDFDRLTRLGLRLEGEADKVHQHEHQHTISLEDLQARRLDARQRKAALPDHFGLAGRGGIPELIEDAEVVEEDELAELPIAVPGKD